MQLYGARQLAEGMRTVRKNTILIAEDISEKDYGYRPTRDSRSVQETLLHIASLWRFDRLVHEEQRLSSLEGFDFGALFKRAETEEKLLRSKSDIVGLLQTQGERWCQWVDDGHLPDVIVLEHLLDQKRRDIRARHPQAQRDRETHRRHSPD